MRWPVLFVATLVVLAESSGAGIVSLLLVLSLACLAVWAVWRADTR